MASARARRSNSALPLSTRSARMRLTDRRWPIADRRRGIEYTSSSHLPGDSTHESSLLPRSRGFARNDGRAAVDAPLGAGPAEVDARLRPVPEDERRNSRLGEARLDCRAVEGRRLVLRIHLGRQAVSL